MNAMCFQGIAPHITMQADGGPRGHEGKLHPHHLPQPILSNDLQPQ
jgi:hypothetical protein